MIRTKNIIVDKRFFDPSLFDNIFGNKKIIDAPSDVAFPCLESIRPPRIFYGIRIKISKGVHIAVFNNPIEPVTLDSQKTGRFFIGFRIFQVDFIVGRVVIATNHKTASCFSERLRVSKESLVEIEFILQSRFAHLAVGKINIEEDKVSQIHFDDAPLGVKPLDTQLICGLAKDNPRLVTVEEHMRQGGFGSAVLECQHDQRLTNVDVLRIGIADTFVTHGSQAELRTLHGLDAAGIEKSVQQHFFPDK